MLQTNDIESHCEKNQVIYQFILHKFLRIISNIPKMASNSVNGTIKLHFKILLNKHNLRKNDLEIYGK